MPNLSGRIAIVTGGSSGLGAAAGEALAAEGAEVTLVARRAERLDTLAAKIRASGGIAHAHATDVTQEANVEALFETVVKRSGRVDLVVNVAGIADHTATDEITLERWQQIVDINLTSVFLMSRAAFRQMKAQKRGRIINVGSVSAKVPRPNNIGYASTKAALDGMTHSLAIDGREFGITASIIHPGSALSELTPDMKPRPPEVQMAAMDVARAITLMASLPDQTNLFEALMLPIGQPFLGRG